MPTLAPILYADMDQDSKEEIQGAMQRIKAGLKQAHRDMKASPAKTALGLSLKGVVGIGRLAWFAYPTVVTLIAKVSREAVHRLSSKAAADMEAAIYALEQEVEKATPQGDDPGGFAKRLGTQWKTLYAAMSKDMDGPAGKAVAALTTSMYQLSLYNPLFPDYLSNAVAVGAIQAVARGTRAATKGATKSSFCPEGQKPVFGICVDESQLGQGRRRVVEKKRERNAKKSASKCPPGQRWTGKKCVVVRRKKTAAKKASARTFGQGRLVGYRYQTAGDDRVRPEHRKLHGRIFKVGEKRPTLPTDPNCRCEYTKVYEGDPGSKSFAQAAGKCCGGCAQGKGCEDKKPRRRRARSYRDTLPRKATAAAAGGYDAYQAADGTWTIRNVPIFAEHVDDRRADEDGNHFTVDKAWLEGALSNARTRWAEGYAPPLHVGHHGHSAVTRAGHWRATHVEQIRLGGEPVWALFADLVGVPGETFERIERGEFPYRSVEILRPDRQEIDSLALLDHEVPFFRFSLLRIKAKHTHQTESAYAACHRYEDGSACLVYRLEDNMATDEAPAPAGGNMASLEAKLDKLIALLMPEEGEQDAEDMEDAESYMDEEEKEEPVNMSQAGPVELPAGKQASFAAAAQGMSDTEAKLYGEIAGLKKQLRSMQTESQASTFFAELSAQGFDDEAVDQVRTFAKSHGLKAAKGFAESMSKYAAASEPPARWSGEITPGSRAGNQPEPPEVQKYRANPELYDEAVSIWRSHQRTGSQIPLADYLKANLDPNPFVRANGTAAVAR